MYTKVVRMTMELRYKKWRLREHTRCTTLKFATKSLIKTRWRTLRLLRATNASEFDRITSALNITGYQHVDPFQIPTEDPIVECKISVRAKYYQRRVVKLAEVKTSITSSEQQFYEQKNSTLSNLLEDLSSLVESNDSQAKKIGAEKLMKELFNEVVEERSLDVLSGPEKDRFSWYAKEAEKRQKLADSQARKAEKQQRKTRK
ncbi:unnamed protein product [Heterobilharzia americana]|nr:unnamed protein product [Heterobilharzia americana]